MSPLPKSLLTPEHKQYLQSAMKVLENLQYHIDQAKRADVPGMDEHQKIKDQHVATITKFLQTYFPGG